MECRKEEFPALSRCFVLEGAMGSDGSPEPTGFSSSMLILASMKVVIKSSHNHKAVHIQLLDLLMHVL